ncbi:Alpha/Beta hydrolase protein [Zychaea mexicana]|uniref:Alpha/Beta hydrolase protein n=1 Tax=Zychaea mexicana TaxID=64656 RepID=UPI0022FEBD39|nr:Alpha/Beta hydrolase protein [Zychaea mexicana]KAI9493383.1 Alpha/Beta hydrolase protein [Zychaea mexicana]
MTVSVILEPSFQTYCDGEKKNREALVNAPTIPEVRENAEKMHAAHQFVDIIEQERTIVQNGHKLRLSLFRPIGTENDILPGVIFYHGGGWAFCSKFTHGKAIRDISIKNNVAVVYVDYTLAPEAKFPIINEECYSTLEWVHENGASINIDTNKLAVCGDSAGGHLSTAIALMAKERGLGEVIKAQILIYPATAPTSEIRESYELFGNGDYGLSKQEALFFKNLYFDEFGNDNKFAYPLLATREELQGLPPTLLITSEADILRDEGEAYARKLVEARVPTCAIRIVGAIHAYFSIPTPKETQAYKQTMALITQQLNDVFAKQ